MSRPAWLTVMVKEVRENLRDRRTMFSALVLGPLMFPALLVVMLSVIGSQQSSDLEKTVDLPVVGAEHAPNLVAYLRQAGINILPAPSDPERAVTEQRAEVVLVIPAEFAAQWAEGRTARLDLWQDGTRQRTRTSVFRVERLLESYGARIGSLRLTVRGIDPSVLRPLSVIKRDAAGVDPLMAMLIAFFPYGLMFSAFMGGMFMAIDTTSGERERQSLEPLLLTPAPRRDLVVGKLAATVLFSMTSLALCVTAMAWGLTLVPPLPGGLELSMEPGVAVRIFLVALPVILLASSAQMLIAAFTRTYREAQTYVQLFQFVPMMPSLVQLISPMDTTTLNLLTPVLGQSILIAQLGKGVPLEAGALLLSWSGTVLVGAVLTAAVIAFYQREKVIS